MNSSKIEIREQSLIQLLRTLRDSGKPAFTRLQVVRAIEFYQRQVLGTTDPDLSPIRRKLEEIAAKEKNASPSSGLSATFSPEAGEKEPGVSSSGADAARLTDHEILPDDDKMLIGKIDSSDPPLLQEMRKLMRVRHYAARTERSYVGWAGRFAGSVGGWTQITATGEVEIKEFLSDLAVNGRVAASTQNQAFHALLFLFRDVLRREMNFLEAERAKRPSRIPVVLSRKEVAATLRQLRDVKSPLDRL